MNKRIRRGVGTVYVWKQTWCVAPAVVSSWLAMITE